MTTGATGQLGLALPVQGELSGTWGDTVNNGITQYTNIAIAGTLTLTGDGAVTLANTTGDASASNITSTLTGAGTVTAQFAIVRVTGTLTVAKVVTGPAYSKTYTVVNAATGGIVTFKAAGQTGVSVAVGESAFVYFNGTDYVKVAGTVAVASFQTSLSGLTPSTATTGAVTLAGTLGVASGGTGLTAGTSGGILGYTATGTLASSVALTANALVLGAGAGATPTPMASLGTTTTVLHGNASGAPTFGAVSLTADVTGVLPTANGGTNLGGATPFTSGGVVYASSTSALATGSALTFDGTNLKINGALILNTAGGSNAYLATVGSGDETLRFLNSAGGELMRISSAVGSAGTVGIGYTSLTSVGDNGLAVLGKVGIGTSSPSQKLEVAGNIKLTDTSPDLFFNVSGGSNYSFMLAAQENVSDTFEITPSTTAGGSTFTSPVYSVSYAGLHKWFNGSTQAMTLSAGGLLSVGTTNASGATIRGLGASNANAYYYLDANGPFGGSPSYSSVLGFALYTDSGTRQNSHAEIKCISDNNYSGSLAFLTQNPGTYPNTVTERMRIGSGGRVGIGTTDPYGNLSVFMGTTAPQDSFYYDSVNMLQIGEASARGLAGLFAKRSTYAGASGYDGDLAFYNLFYAGAADYQWKERMRIQANGNVGMGTTAPDCKLHVEAADGAVGGAIRYTATSVASVYMSADPNGLCLATDTAGITFRTGVSGNDPTDTGSERARITSDGNLLVGSTSTAGTNAPSAITVAGRLRSVAGATASIANGATVDIALTMPRAIVSYYIVSNDNSNHMSAGFFRANDVGASSNYTLFSQSEANVAVTSPSAGIIRITNNTGSTNLFNYSFTVLSGT